MCRTVGSGGCHYTPVMLVEERYDIPYKFHFVYLFLIDVHFYRALSFVVCGLKSVLDVLQTIGMCDYLIQLESPIAKYFDRAFEIVNAVDNPVAN